MDDWRPSPRFPGRVAAGIGTRRDGGARFHPRPRVKLRRPEAPGRQPLRAANQKKSFPARLARTKAEVCIHPRKPSRRRRRRRPRRAEIPTESPPPPRKERPSAVAADFQRHAEALGMSDRLGGVKFGPRGTIVATLPATSGTAHQVIGRGRSGREKGGGSAGMTVRRLSLRTSPLLTGGGGAYKIPNRRPWRVSAGTRRSHERPLFPSRTLRRGACFFVPRRARDLRASVLQSQPAACSSRARGPDAPSSPAAWRS